ARSVRRLPPAGGSFHPARRVSALGRDGRGVLHRPRAAGPLAGPESGYRRHLLLLSLALLFRRRAGAVEPGRPPRGRGQERIHSLTLRLSRVIQEVLMFCLMGSTVASAQQANAAGGTCCPVVELRQYTLHPGQRDVLIDLFDREFVETQEAEGMRVLGQFRDLDNPNRFVWLRGFSDMPGPAHALCAFYGGPAWKAHSKAANATMVDSSNVLLLRPTRPTS